MPLSVYLLLLLGLSTEGVKVTKGDELDVHGVDLLAQHDELRVDLVLQLLHLLQVLAQLLVICIHSNHIHG